ncbi:MAG TPA: hypothetical protein VGE16_03690 [Albitalea sp.]
MSRVEVSIVNGYVTVDRETLSMVGKGRNAPIQWNLTTPGWTFPSNGIEIEGNDGEFTQLRPTDEGTKFKCMDRNTGGKAYKYNINVTNGKTTLSLDPIIQNEP